MHKFTQSSGAGFTPVALDSGGMFESVTEMSDPRQVLRQDDALVVVDVPD
jgi:hypothetical protein